MLVDEIVDFCNKQYTSLGVLCGQEDGKCTHPSGVCSGSCYNCLHEIHFPGRVLGSKKLYDCPKMICQYVCQYSYLYATELLCAFASEWEFIKYYPYYHIASLGCGGCADLMAFEALQKQKNISQPISYIGIDVNQLWRPVHSKIEEYCLHNTISFKTRYYDVFDYFQKNRVSDANIIVISYLISYLYNTEQIAGIDSLAHRIAENIVNKKEAGQHLLLVINDVNSWKRGRDYFSRFESAIKNCGLNILRSTYRHFDTGRLYSSQKIGTPYDVPNRAFNIPIEIQNKYQAKNLNATIQLILEVM